MFPVFLAAAGPGASSVPTATATLNPALAAQLQQSLLQNVHPQTPLAHNAPWLTHTIAGLFVIAAVLLVVLLAVQTTKQEGLSGTIGGRVESAYKGRLGADEQLKRMTSYVAIGYVIVATLLSISGI